MTNQQQKVNMPRWPPTTEKCVDDAPAKWPFADDKHEDSAHDYICE